MLALAFFALSNVSTRSVHLESQNVVPIVTSIEQKSVTILAFGDIMLDRSVRERMNTYGEEYPFVKIKDLLRGNDIVYANLEGSITNHPSRTAYKINAPLVFTFSTTTAPLLSRLGFNILGLANNHSLNYGLDGLIETRRHLKENNIDYFGDPNNIDGISIVKEVNGMKIAFIGLHEFSNKNFDKVISEITQICPEVSFCVVVPHWGVEYNKNFTVDQQQKAHEFIDAGASLILGGHSHVVGPFEIYKNKAIFYSLGNFIFDQDFSYDTTHALVVRITISNKDIHYDLIPISIVKSQAAVSSAVDKEKMWKTLGTDNFTLSR